MSNERAELSPKQQIARAIGAGLLTASAVAPFAFEIFNPATADAAGDCTVVAKVTAQWFKKSNLTKNGPDGRPVFTPGVDTILGPAKNRTFTVSAGKATIPMTTNEKGIAVDDRPDTKVHGHAHADFKGQPDAKDENGKPGIKVTVKSGDNGDTASAVIACDPSGGIMERTFKTFVEEGPLKPTTTPGAVHAPGRNDQLVPRGGTLGTPVAPSPTATRPGGTPTATPTGLPLTPREQLDPTERRYPWLTLAEGLAAMGLVAGALCWLRNRHNRAEIRRQTNNARVARIDRDDAAAARDEFQAQRDSALEFIADEGTELEQAHTDLAIAQANVATVEAERDAALAEADQNWSAAEAAVIANDGNEAVIDALTDERDDYMQAGFDLAQRATLLDGALDTAIDERNNALIARTDLEDVVADAAMENVALVGDRDAAIADRDAAVAERDTAIAERDAIQANRDEIADRVGSHAVALDAEAARPTGPRRTVVRDIADDLSGLV